MKANEFVKKFGLCEAVKVSTSKSKYFCKELKKGGMIVTNSYSDTPDLIPNAWVLISDLKRLVESHELVRDYYGLTRAKEHAESNYTAPELKAALKQAIADVESCL